jgi:ABC-type antimicrobial peptide transport system permease subunit
VVLIGAVFGLAGAVAAARFVRAMLFDVSPTDPASLASVTLILVCVALVAAFIPARRAARVDPVGALRAD